MPGVMTKAFTFAPAIDPTASVTAPDTTYGPTGKAGPPTTTGGAVGALGTDVGPLPHPASSSAMETPSASCVVTGSAIGDMQPSLIVPGGHGSNDFEIHVASFKGSTFKVQGSPYRPRFSLTLIMARRG